jgi:tryptophan-rich sensory protein
MVRERALRVVLILIGLLFTAGVYPMLVFFSREPALAMMLSLYVTLGILLLLAARNPSANRSLIAFTAWSSFAHAGVMGLQVYRHIVGHVELPGVVGLAIIGLLLVALSPEPPAHHA